MNNGRNMLWYREPARSWNEALPLGNGRLGAMVFGGVREERIALNEDSLWTGYPAFCDQPEDLNQKPCAIGRIQKNDVKGFFGTMEEYTGTLWEYRQFEGSYDHGFASYALVVIKEALRILQNTKKK